MNGIGLWQVSEDQTSLLAPSVVGLEEHLEVWIENDSAVLETEPVVVAHQLRTVGGPLDLLPIDRRGRVRDGEILAWIPAEAWEQFFGVDAAVVVDRFGGGGRIGITSENVLKAAASIKDLLRSPSNA
jgi:hypothetical protein